MRPVFRFLESLDREQAARRAPPSILGSQLDKMRDGTCGIDFRNPEANADRHGKYAVRLLIWKAVPPLARRAIRLKQEIIVWEARFREVPEAELVADTRFSPPVLTTKQGEVLALERERQFPPAAGWRIVQSQRPVFRKNSEVAQVLQISERHLRLVLQKAYEQIEDHPAFEDAMR